MASTLNVHGALGRVVDLHQEAVGLADVGGEHAGGRQMRGRLCRGERRRRGQGLDKGVRTAAQPVSPRRGFMCHNLGQRGGSGVRPARASRCSSSSPPCLGPYNLSLRTQGFLKDGLASHPLTPLASISSSSRPAVLHCRPGSPPVPPVLGPARSPRPRSAARGRRGPRPERVRFPGASLSGSQAGRLAGDGNQKELGEERMRKDGVRAASKGVECGPSDRCRARVRAGEHEWEPFRHDEPTD
jgi:hypothetical protein